ncbi:MAG: N-6 DNA methylase, partial [Turicibacter sp.]
MDYSIKAVKKHFKDNGIYYTPPELALFLKSLIDVEYEDVYDPTCGRGNLLEIFPNNVKKYGQELNEIEYKVACDKLINFKGAWGDTLKHPSFMNRQFDLIIANPPFSIPWDVNETDIRFKDAGTIPTKSKADFVFIFHCLHLLKSSGMAIILCHPGVCYRGNREHKLRKYLVDNNFIEKVISVEGNTFADTAIPT